MSSVVGRYGNKGLTSLAIRSAPRIVVLSGVAAIAAEWAGAGFVDFLWGSLNRGVRTDFAAIEAHWAKSQFFLLVYTHQHTQAFYAPP